MENKCIIINIGFLLVKITRTMVDYQTEYYRVSTNS